MKIDVSFGDLDALISEMGADRIEWTASGQSLEKLNIDLGDGVDLINLDDVIAAPGGLLSYRGQVVLLYIKDPKEDRDTLLNKPEKANRFHVADCKTLERMRDHGRFERYVVTNNTSGIFKVGAWDSRTNEREPLEAELKVCKDCLRNIDYKDYADSPRGKQRQIWHNFSISEFLEKYTPTFYKKPTHTDMTAPQGGYTTDWKDISHKYRNEVNWKCEKCKVDISRYHSLLDCHHKSGVTSDNSNSNLQALCKICHREAPLHHNMHVGSVAETKIKKLREWQKNREEARINKKLKCPKCDKTNAIDSIDKDQGRCLCGHCKTTLFSD